MIARRVRRRDAELVGRAGRIAGHDVAFVAAVALLRTDGDGLAALTSSKTHGWVPPAMSWTARHLRRRRYGTLCC